MAGAGRRGQRIALSIYGLIVVGFTTVCSIQILIAVYDPDDSTRAVSCRDGIRGLVTGVERAREAAGNVDGERAALAIFRAKLDPEWQTRPALEQQCQGDSNALQTLRAVDRLRYAEEHAVRRAELDLGPRRREVQRLSSRLAPAP